MIEHIVPENKLGSWRVNESAYNEICTEIEGNRVSSIPQPVIVIGQEGAGKTTLLRRVLKQCNHYPFVWIDGRSIFSSTDIIDQAKEVALLIIDNLEYFLKRCTYDEQFRLRRFLNNEGAPMLIATASKLLPALTEYKAPFFEGLKKIHLPPLDIDEFLPFLEGVTRARVVRLFDLLPPVIRSVEVIVGIIQSNADENEDIEMLLSLYSALYVHTYSSLPDTSQRILNILGDSVSGLTIPELRADSGLTAGVLTAYIKGLHTKGLVSVDKTVKRYTKYSVKDPLFRLWLKKERFSLAQ